MSSDGVASPSTPHRRRERRLGALTLGLWLLGGAAVAAPALWLQFDSDRWLPPEHPQERALDELEREFAPGETLAVVLPMAAGSFSAEGVDRLLSLEAALKAELRDDLVSIRSPASAQRIAADGKKVRIEEFHAAMRRGAFASRADYRRAFAGSPYGGRLASPDGSLAVLLLRLDTSEQAERRRRVMRKVRAVLDREGVGGQAHFAGGAALRDTINERVRRQTLQFAAAGAGVIALFLVLFLRSVRRAFPVLAAALLVIAGSLSWIVVLGHKMTVTTLALPVLAAVIAVADGLHILAHRDALRRPRRAGAGAAPLPVHLAHHRRGLRRFRHQRPHPAAGFRPRLLRRHHVRLPRDRARLLERVPLLRRRHGPPAG